MTKITAIEGGGDWADASVEYLVLPDWMDIAKEHAAYNEWYNNSYCSDRIHHKYKSFCKWLLERGAREPNDDELDVFCDD